MALFDSNIFDDVIFDTIEVVGVTHTLNQISFNIVGRSFQSSRSFELTSSDFKLIGAGISNALVQELATPNLKLNSQAVQDATGRIEELLSVVLPITPYSFQTSRTTDTQSVSFTLSAEILESSIAIVQSLNPIIFKFNTTSLSQVVMLSADEAVNYLAYSKLRSLGYRGQINDMLYDFFDAGGNAINDREYNWLVARTGVQDKSSSDLWMIYLKNLGYSGSFSDMIRQFWINY